MTSTAPTLGEALFDALAAHGARAIFGIPGDFALSLFRAARRSSLPVHVLAHEPGVGFAADAAARYSGGLGVALVTWGAGALNLVNPIANAYAEKIPLVVVSGAPGLSERERPWLIHHQVRSLRSQSEIMAEITADQALLEDPATAPAAIARVLETCRTRSLPVYLEVPRDLVFAPSAPVPLPADRDAAPTAVAAAAHAVAAALQAAQRPLILIDIEARRFGAEDLIAALASRLHIPVLTTFTGRGLLAGHGLVQGSWLGSLGDPAAEALVATSDLILGLGVLPSDTNLAGMGGRPFSALPNFIDASEGHVAVAGQRFSAPLAAFVAALDVASAHVPSFSPRRLPEPTSPSPLAQAAPPTSDDIVDAVATVLRRVGPLPVVSDVGDCLFSVSRLRENPIIAPGYYATMGYAVPAALGICGSSSDRPIVLVGDGAFLMTGAELAAAAAHHWDPIVIVFDNQSWKMIAIFDDEPGAHALPKVDFVALSESLGGHGERVTRTDALVPALERALKIRGKPSVIHVLLAEGSVSEGMRRFAERLAPDRSGRLPGAC